MGGKDSNFEIAEADALHAKIGYLCSGYLSGFDGGGDGEVGRATAMQTYRAGSVLYTPGESGEVFFILKQGVVQTYRMSAEGRKLVIARFEPVSFSGK
jgi:hypothetical protein